MLAEVLRDPEQLARFSDEARITARLSHEHVIRVLDHGADEGVPWIAYELIEGRTQRALASESTLPLAKALAAVSQVCAALDAAHALGIVHRDIKPDNVMEACDGHFKVADFGIARTPNGREVRTKTGAVLGTPAYIAPELLQGEVASPRSDVYATRRAHVGSSSIGARCASGSSWPGGRWTHSVRPTTSTAGRSA